MKRKPAMTPEERKAYRALALAARRLQEAQQRAREEKTFGKESAK